MAVIGGLLCKCSERRNSCPSWKGLTCLESSQSRRSRVSKSRNLRNVSMVPLFKNSSPRWRSLVGKTSRVFSMDSREISRSMILQSSKQKKVPVFVMMPFDSIRIDASGTARIKKTKALSVSLKALKLAGVHGIAVEVWWGLVEHACPSMYNWSIYEELFRLIAESGLKLHVALSFHSNMHSSPQVKGSVRLPPWVLEIGSLDGDIYYKDESGYSNEDYLTLGIDHAPVLHGRTALQCYEDFIHSFLDKFDSIMGSVIEEIGVGLGPGGELRYPAHPYGDGRWRFPGIGEFQCYDKYMLEDLRVAAHKEGKPEWGIKGPQNAGCYNSSPTGVPFFQDGQESFISDYGRFFLEWYSSKLIRHADSILAKAAEMLKKYQKDEERSVLLVAKIGLVYWWYQTFSHPAELTAGYYNTLLRDGYDSLASVLRHHGAALHLSCLEMTDRETKQAYLCSPEGLLQQLRALARRRTLVLTGRNFDERLDKESLQRIQANCYHPQADTVKSFTYFRMSGNIFRAENWNNFVPFVRNMNNGQ